MTVYSTYRSDFVYMVPPFLAYYGVLTQNATLLQLAYDQCRLYRQYLVDDDAGGIAAITGTTGAAIADADAPYAEYDCRLCAGVGMWCDEVECESEGWCEPRGGGYAAERS